MKTASSSSPSPPLPRPTTSETRTTPAIIKLDYNYTTMSPSSSRSQQLYQHHHHHARSAAPVPREVDVEIDALDSQYSSLFGDPVPPPPPAAEELFSTQYSEAVNFLRRSSMEISSEEEAFGERTNVRRLFSETPYSSSISRRLSNGTIAAPRLQPPDIQILPNSSGGSSSEPRDSPNFALLTPDDILRRPSLYDITEPADASEMLETMTISDATGRREYSEATRRVSSFSEDFKSNVGSLGSPPPDVPELPKAYTRQFSNESYSSSEWFRPAMHDFSEFSKMPRLRPSSKKVMSIKRDEMPMQHSPVAAMINDSNGSSSGEERLLDTTVTLEHPTVPLPEFQSPERQSVDSPHFQSELGLDLLLSPRAYLQQRRKSTLDSMGLNFPLPPPPQQIAQTPILERVSEVQETEVKPLKRELSPVITTDSVAMGGDYRVEQAKLHKKTAFTIITDKSPQSSRTQSPVSFHHKSQISPFLGYGFRDTPPTIMMKPVAKPRHHLQRKSLSSTQLKLPQLKPNLITSDDSPRPSVQFNMTARHSPSKMPQKGILQHRESLSSSLDQDHLLPSKDLLPPNALPSSALAYGPKMKSCETLPLITDPYRTAIPRLNRSSLDLSRESAVIPPGALPRPLKPNPNPTRKQRGLLRVINSADSLSRIPLRSNWASMDDILIGHNRRPTLTPLSMKGRRRSSSTSPERRSSTQTASDRRSSNLSSVTTSDFSFRRPSLTPQPKRRKSLFATNSPNMQRRQSVAPPISAPKTPRTPRNKIAKPSTLSPIIGTPNKDSSTPQSPAVPTSFVASETASESASRRGSLSKIPVRSAVNSRSNSRMSSRAGSRRNSRSNSPVKDLAALHLNLSGLTSRATSSRSPSRATARSESQQSTRANSKAASRSTSRASTKPLSRGPSRASSRPNSRMDQAKSVANSRSNSRLSQRSAPRPGSVSPTIGHKKTTPFNRRKSVSLSPKAKRRTPARRGSISPSSNRKSTRSRKTPELQRRNSRSRIPTRAKSDLQSTSKSPTKPKSPATNGLRKKSSLKADKIRQKEPASAKKAPTAVQKPASSVKRTPSSVKKQIAAAKKQPSKGLKAEGSNLKREVTNVQKKTSVIAAAKEKTAKREASSVSLKKAANTEELKRQGSTLSAKAVAQKAAESKKGSSNENGAKSNEATATKDNATVGNKIYDKKGLLKRQASKLSLMRMGSNLSLLNKKRPDSSLSKKLEEISIGEETELNGQSGENSGSNEETVRNATALAHEKTQKPTEASAKSDQQKVLDGEAIKTGYESAASPTSSMATVVENKGGKGESASRSGTAEGAQAAVKSPATNSHAERATAKSPAPPTQPVEAAVSVVNAGTNGTKIAASPQQLATGENADLAERVSERAISVLPEVESESANFQNFELGFNDKTDVTGGGGDGSGDGITNVSAAAVPIVGSEQTSGSGDEYKTDAKRRSPDGQGGSASGSGDKTGSQEYLEGKENEEKSNKRGCCSCCTKLCMPCRRSRCSRCCQRKKPLTTTNNNNDEAEQPVLTPPSSAASTATTNLEVIDEKKSCWRKLNCCKRKKKTAEEKKIIASKEEKMETIHEETIPETAPAATGPRKQSKCGLCLSKIFCCRSVNKVKTTTESLAADVADEMEVRKCCFCIPCRRKRRATRGSAVGSLGSSTAWQDPERAITATDASVLEGVDAAAPKQGCCKRFWSKLLCCKKKAAPLPSDSRRASIKPPPPAEDTRRKLHVDLVEYNSKMKGAIPVLPLYLAWFCAICNTIFPGLGTLFSGLFCICVGIPRFSQYDSAKARFGSLIINIIVAISQLFCVLFCFVGWGWSIWWGTIMLKCARKLNRIKKVERLEMEEERRQAEQEAAAAAAAVITRAPIPVSEPEAAKA